MSRMLHVTWSRNRASIAEHGLDWTRMTGRGIAGSHRPEADGVYLARDEFEADFFVRMGGTDPVDVWAADGVDESELVEFDTGFVHLPRPIPASALTLLRRDVTAPVAHEQTGAGAYSSRLTVVLDDGKVLDGDEVRAARDDGDATA